jgi:hypothetical protein
LTRPEQDSNARAETRATGTASLTRRAPARVDGGHRTCCFRSGVAGLTPVVMPRDPRTPSKIR